jgi:hypothetical protein
MDTRGTLGNVYKSWAFREPQPQRNRPHGYNHTCAKQDGTGDVYIISELAVIHSCSFFEIGLVSFWIYMDSWYRKSFLMQFRRDWVGLQCTPPLLSLYKSGYKIEKNALEF